MPKGTCLAETTPNSKKKKKKKPTALVVVELRLAEQNINIKFL